MKIAVFWPNWIGDAVMATPAVRALRQHFTATDFVSVLKPYIAGVLEGLPGLDRQMFLDSKGPWDQQWPAVAWRLRREKIDLALLFPNTFRSALVAWLGKCQRRVGYTRYARSWLLTDKLDAVRDTRGNLKPSPILDAYNKLATLVGCPAPSQRMELFTTSRDEAAAEAVWQQAGFTGQSKVVCLNPGAAFGAAKFWPAEYFVKLAQDLVDHHGYCVLVLCGPGERGLAREIALSAERREVHALSDHPLSLGLTKACVRRAELLVTTDSGPRHFAAALNRPVVTLFGPTHIGWTETHYAKAVQLQKKVDCGPCQRRVCPLDHRCMKLLTPNEVLEAVVDLLARCRELDAAPRLSAAG